MSFEEGPCEYCLNKAPIFIGPPESAVKSFVCRACLKLLKNPATALPLIRGNLTMKLRGKIAPGKLQEVINRFMEKISGFRPRN